jgi:hypothetical protein
MKDCYVSLTKLNEEIVVKYTKKHLTQNASESEIQTDEQKFSKVKDQSKSSKSEKVKFFKTQKLGFGVETGLDCLVGLVVFF